MLHRHARPAVAGCFIAGSVAGALSTGLALVILAGLLSPVPLAARSVAALLTILAVALHQSGLVRLRLPQSARQIPPGVFRNDPRRAAARFAFELGTGVRTYVTTAAPYALIAILVLTPPPGWTGVAVSLLAAVSFGAGRGLIIGLQAATRRVAVDHPARWLHAAAWVSLAASAIVVARHLPW